MCVAAVYHSYAKDSAKFEAMFAHSWYKLTTRDMGPATRCTGDLKPPAQPWQYPLPPPPPPGRLPNFMEVAAAIEAILSVANPVLPPDYYDGVPNYGPLFVRLAWQCASTFRATDYLGGCNGKLVVLRTRHRVPNVYTSRARLYVCVPAGGCAHVGMGVGMVW
jgi:catalase (peroxidase I)